MKIAIATNTLAGSGKAVKLAATIHPILVIEKGKHLNLPFIDYYNTQKINIKSNLPIQSHVDGEYLESHEFNIEILPAHFNFIF